MFIEALAFILGVLYGLLNPRKENRIKMLKKAVVIGIILGVVFGILWTLLLIPFGFIHPLVPIAGFILGTLSGVVVGIITVLYFALFFIIGTFIGDLLESVIR